MNPPRLHLSPSVLRRMVAVMDEPGDGFVALMRVAGLDPARDFRGAVLDGVDFGADDLSGFDFSGTDLSKADMSRATGLEHMITNGMTRLPQHAQLRSTTFLEAIMRGVDTKFGRRAATCAASIRATIETEKKTLAPIRPIVESAIRLLNEELSQNSIEEMGYDFARIEEFIAKWRPSPNPNPNPSFLYIQPNWAESIDNDAQVARSLVADLAKEFSENAYSSEQYISKSTPVVKGRAFVAMAIDPTDHSLDDVLDAIKATCVECKIDARRIDEDQSNERITDRIVEAIRAAEFVIVDLTLTRPNVFFEAGFAHGLGKTPIYIARDGTKPEFDIKDYPIIFFRSMRDLRAGLTVRLKALSASQGRELAG